MRTRGSARGCSLSRTHLKGTKAHPFRRRAPGAGLREVSRRADESVCPVPTFETRFDLSITKKAAASGARRHQPKSIRSIRTGRSSHSESAVLPQARACRATPPAVRRSFVRGHRSCRLGRALPARACDGSVVIFLFGMTTRRRTGGVAKRKAFTVPPRTTAALKEHPALPPRAAAERRLLLTYLL